MLTDLRDSLFTQVTVEDSAEKTSKRHENEIHAWGRRYGLTDGWALGAAAETLVRWKLNGIDEGGIVVPPPAAHKQGAFVLPPIDGWDPSSESFRKYHERVTEFFEGELNAYARFVFAHELRHGW